MFDTLIVFLKNNLKKVVFETKLQTTKNTCKIKQHTKKIIKMSSVIMGLLCL